MVFLLKKGIIATLKKEFSDLAVYGERVEQGFLKPSFFVSLKNAGGRREIGRRRRRSAEFDIHYYPADGAKRNEAMYAMGDRLLELFESVETGDGPLRPADARYEIVDDVLHFFVSFRWFALAEEAAVSTVAKIDTEVINGR